MTKLGGLKKLQSFLKRHWVSLVIVFLAFSVISYIVWDSYRGGVFNPADTPIPKKPVETRVQAPLSGRLVSPDRAARTPLAIVIENHPSARPQSGLNQASLVYETLAEGGITRFLAFFQEEDVKEIGPIRSARVYFVEWAKSYNAAFAHVGGNSNGLDLIKILRVYDLNQFSLASYFWRDKSRYAPHNVYSSTENLYKAATQNKIPLTAQSVPAFIFKKEPAEAERGESSSFRVELSPSYGASYSYNKVTNAYQRSMLGKPHLDKTTKEPITIKNLVIAYSEFSNGKSRTGQQMVNIRTIGSGTAVMFQDGKRIDGSWKRPTQGAVMRFYDLNGAEMPLNPGLTWVSFFPVGTPIR